MWWEVLGCGRGGKAAAVGDLAPLERSIAAVGLDRGQPAQHLTPFNNMSGGEEGEGSICMTIETRHSEFHAVYILDLLLAIPSGPYSSSQLIYMVQMNCKMLLFNYGIYKSSTPTTVRGLCNIKCVH